MAPMSLAPSHSYTVVTRSRTSASSSSPTPKASTSAPSTPSSIARPTTRSGSKRKKPTSSTFTLSMTHNNSEKGKGKRVNKEGDVRPSKRIRRTVSFKAGEMEFEVSTCTPEGVAGPSKFELSYDEEEVEDEDHERSGVLTRSPSLVPTVIVEDNHDLLERFNIKIRDFALPAIICPSPSASDSSPPSPIALPPTLPPVIELFDPYKGLGMFYRRKRSSPRVSPTPGKLVRRLLNLKLITLSEVPEIDREALSAHDALVVTNGGTEYPWRLTTKRLPSVPLSVDEINRLVMLEEVVNTVTTQDRSYARWLATTGWMTTVLVTNALEKRKTPEPAHDESETMEVQVTKRIRMTATPPPEPEHVFRTPPREVIQLPTFTPSPVRHPPPLQHPRKKGLGRQSTLTAF